MKMEKNYEMFFTVPTTDDDFYFLIEGRNDKKLFRTRRVGMVYSVYWEEQDRICNLEKWYDYSIIIGFVEKGAWIKQDTIPETILTTLQP